MKQVIVSFSSRKHGNCESISHYIHAILPDSSIFCFSDFKISPCGGCLGECFHDRKTCPYFLDMEYTILEQITTADMAYFIVPNHCDYPCANFFIFNERSQCFFQGNNELLRKYLAVPKKFIVISNSENDHFRECFLQHMDDSPKILFFSANKYGKSSISGDILTSREARKHLGEFINA